MSNEEYGPSTDNVIERLKAARAVAWGNLQPAFDHAIILAQEAEATSSQACIEYATYVSAVYPPLVLKLAASGDGLEKS